MTDYNISLLLVTFELDLSHGTLAWQTNVVRELARRVKHLSVITSRLGRVDGLPDNVEILVTPARPLGIPYRFGGAWAFNGQVYSLCRKRRFDAVFVHMAMEWAYRLFPTFALFQLPVVLWYAHGTVTNRLRMAVRCVDRVVTSTPEGCRINSDKIVVIGQAIATRLYDVSHQGTRSNVLYVGRISSRKRVDLIIDVAEHMRTTNPDLPIFQIIGPLLTQADIAYDHLLRDRIWRSGLETTVRMIGFVPRERLPEIHAGSFVHLSLSQTGSMDKTVMEALACGCPVLTTNEAFFELLGDYPEFILREDHPRAIAERIEYIRERKDSYDPQRLRQLVTGAHSLDTYADRVLRVIEECRRERGITQ